MDLITLVTACSLTIEPRIMHSLVWEQSRGEPWSFSVPGESLARVLPTRDDALREARAVRPEGARIRVGLAGVSTDARSATGAMFAPCANITLAARQLAGLAERCSATATAEPIYCAIAAYHGSWDQPDTWFADAVRSSVERAGVPNIDMPNDSYFDASDTAARTPPPNLNASPHTRLTTSDERERGWFSALFPASALHADRSSTDTNESSVTQESSTSRADDVPPVGNARAAETLFVPTSSERRQ
jgi:hypothetical protein